jgi:hypothetical protein
MTAFLKPPDGRKPRRAIFRLHVRKNFVKAARKHFLEIQLELCGIATATHGNPRIDCNDFLYIQSTFFPDFAQLGQHGQTPPTLQKTFPALALQQCCGKIDVKYLYFQSAFRTCAGCGAETAFREANQKVLDESLATRKLRFCLGDSGAASVVYILRGSKLIHCRNVCDVRTASGADQSAVCRSTAGWRTSLPATM